MKSILPTILLLTSPAHAVFPGAGSFCESLLDEDQAICEFMATWDPLHDDFFLRDDSGDIQWFDPFGLLDDDADFQWFDPFGLLDDNSSPPPPSPSPPPPENENGEVASGDA